MVAVATAVVATVAVATAVVATVAVAVTGNTARRLNGQ
jgi:hypothetical protein